jgi:hypothetical protein
MSDISINQLQSMEAQLLADNESYMDGITEEEQTQIIGAGTFVVVSAVTVSLAAADASGYNCAAAAAGITGGIGASVGAVVDYFD